MKLSRIRALRGPNLWCRRTAVEAVIELTDEELDIEAWSGFVQALYHCVPRLRPMSTGGDGGPLTLAHALCVAALSLQTEADIPVTFSRVARTPDPRTVQVIVEYSEEAVGRRALDLAVQMTARLREHLTFDLQAAVAALKELDEDQRLGPSTAAIVRAASRRGIPFRRLTEGSLVQLGWGSRQRHIQAAEMDSTSIVAERIAQDKELTKFFLRAVGVPVPRGQVVRDVQEAWETAQRFGLPAVVKPLDGNHGRGVTVNIRSHEHLVTAFDVAQREGAQVLVEKYLPGQDYRLLVVGRQLVAAARREPPHVVGDGKSTISDLVAEVNRDPRRGDGHASSLTKIRLDEIAVARLKVQGLEPNSIPSPGQKVTLRHNANLSTGGTATDVTDEVHPAIADRAIKAAQAVGLHIAGVDLVCESLHLPLEEQAGGVVEVNAAPGLRMHLDPSYGMGRPVGEAIMDAMWKPGEDGRIPLVAVTGTNGKTTTVRLIAHILASARLRVGLTTTDGIEVDGRVVDTGDCSGPRSARAVLSHPDVDAAVLETARGGILREGLAFDRCDVAVVTNIGRGDHLGLNYITTVEDLAVLKRVIVASVRKTGFAVLNLDDPIAASFAGNCPGQAAFFTRRADHTVVSAYRASGTPIAYVADGQLVVIVQGQELRVRVEEIPLTKGGAVGFQVENVLAAALATLCLKVPVPVIESALRSFLPGSGTTKGRFNEYALRGAKVVLDYGHNPDAMYALAMAVQGMPATRRTVVISGAGDRRDEDIRQQTEILAEAFDQFILYQDACQRGRADGEVLALLQEGLRGFTGDVHVVRGEQNAIDLAVARLVPGEICLILIDQIDLAIAHLEKMVACESEL